MGFTDLVSGVNPVYPPVPVCCGRPCRRHWKAYGVQRVVELTVDEGLSSPARADPALAGHDRALGAFGARSPSTGALGGLAGSGLSPTTAAAMSAGRGGPGGTASGWSTASPWGMSAAAPLERGRIHPSMHGGLPAAHTGVPVVYRRPSQPSGYPASAYSSDGVMRDTTGATGSVGSPGSAPIVPSTDGAGSVTTEDPWINPSQRFLAGELLDACLHVHRSMFQQIMLQKEVYQSYSAQLGAAEIETIMRTASVELNMYISVRVLDAIPVFPDLEAILSRYGWLQHASRFGGCLGVNGLTQLITELRVLLHPYTTPTARESSFWTP